MPIATLLVYMFSRILCYTSTPFSANKVDISTMAESNDNRFVAKVPDVEDRLKADTVGLVTLDDFRKRRAEAAEGGSGATTPDGR